MTSNHRSPTMSTQPPTKRRPPSPRNLEIYRAVRIQLRSQVGVALQYNLSQAPISQIVKNVGERLAELLPGEDLKQTFATAERARLLDWDAHQRRIEQYRKCDLVFGQSRQPLIEGEWTL